MKIDIITTGGTIDKIYFDQKNEFQVGDPQAEGLLERANVVVDYEVISILRKDSLDLTKEDRRTICESVKRCTTDRIVITHGTDTMIETGCLLNAIKDKTIVLTGSMYPAKFHDSDAVYNIASAVTAVQLLTAGVYIAMNGRIFSPLKSKKNIELNRFEEK